MTSLQSARQHPSTSGCPQASSLLVFFLLVFALSVPFWVIGALTGLMLFPGLPVGALMAFSPLIAALIMVRREGPGAASALLRHAFDYERIRRKAWYVPILLLMPAMTLLAYELMRLTGAELPSPRLPALAMIVMFLVFFIPAIGEEVGWSGYAIERIQSRCSALAAALMLGAIWAIWHLVPLLQAGRSVSFIAWHGLNTVLIRVLMVWLYNNTGRSVFAAVLFHVMLNVCYFMFPNFGSHYDPRFLTPVVVCVTLIVIAVWGPRTLAGLPRS